MSAPPEHRAGRLCLVVALRAEATPLIEHFRLRRLARQGPMRGFADAEGHITLLLTGVGREAARTAVARFEDPSVRAWLNVGIAGHRDLPVGTPLLAHRVVDVEAKRSWYPPFAFEPPMPTATIRTVGRACLDYPTEDVYEMEAAGFYAAAARHASHELVQCIKVISDNLSHPAASLTARRVSELVAASLPSIERTVDKMRGLAAEQAHEHELRVAPAGFRALRAGTHFTTTQRRRLRRLLRRFAALHPDTDVVAWIAAGGASEAAGTIIERLETHLEQAAPHFENEP
jgi:nucleoside phosphorylase